MDVSIIMVTYNSAKYIQRCFESIKKYMNEVSYEIIVVDNSSSDETISLLHDHWPEAKVIENNFNAGFAVACNQGALVAQGDFLFLLNADTELLDNRVGEAVSYARVNGTAVIGPKTLGMGDVPLITWKKHNSLYLHMLDLASGALRVNRFFKSKQPALDDAVRNVAFLTGSALLISRSAYERLGLFDEQFFFTGEERDFCMRVTRSGLELVYYPAWTIRHDVGHGKSCSAFHHVNWVKSSLKLARKHGGFFGYTMMVITLGLYSLSLATLSSIRHILDFSNPDKTLIAKTYRRLLYWYFGLVSEQEVLSPG